jgi:hypothetical protein
MPRITTAQADAAQNAAIVPATGYFLSLHTADPGTTGASEGTDGRKAITFASSSGGSQASNSAQSWPSAVGGQTYTFFGVWTAITAGTYLRGVGHDRHRRLTEHQQRHHRLPHGR